MADSVMIALSTCPDENSAASIAATLVKEGLATCVNRIGPVRSTYVWDGRLHDEREILLLMKTTAGRLSALEARLKELHPYELPELVALPVTGGNERYLDWVRSGVRGAAPNPDPGQT
jgi:periplasmic divalent cation tolerance protein